MGSLNNTRNIMETEHINQLQNQLTDLSQRNADIRDYMDYQGK